MRGPQDPWHFQRWAIDVAVQERLDATEAHVLTVLAIYADADGETFVSLAKLADAIRRRERQTTEALASLKRRGLIERRGRGPGRTPVTRLVTRDTPRLIDSQSAATQDPDSRHAATDDSRLAAPLTRGGPRPELPLQPPLRTDPPNPPQAGGDPLPPLARGRESATPRSPTPIDSHGPSAAVSPRTTGEAGRRSFACSDSR